MKKSVKILEEVLKEFNSTGKFPYSTLELKDLNCYYYNRVRQFMIEKGFMTMEGVKLRPIVIANMQAISQSIKQYADYRNRRLAKGVKSPKKEESLPPLERVLEQYVTKLSSKSLADELRNRGYEVTATKTVEL